ncbi:helix-turn-helix domain-containing protein [Natrarchaeobius chitinivorans]|nr:helix-turn-helix domain-containing protein [Natrarchaeobius chitinivorans]
MGIIAEFELGADEFVLEDALLVSEIDRIEFDRVVADRKGGLSFFWVWGANFETFERIVANGSDVAELVHVDSVEDGRLYRAEWSDSVGSLVRGIELCGASMLSGTGEGDGWSFEIRFSGTDDFTEFSNHCLETDLNLALNDVHTVSRPDSDLGYGLTSRQRELLIEAATKGYYDEPRSVSLRELADDFGISAPSASGLLRRGTHRLITSTILSEE